MFKIIKYVLYLVIIVTMIFPVMAQNIPQLINYQGFLTDADGKALTGPQTLLFRLYPDTSMGSNWVWSEEQSVEVVNGLYNVLLGSTTPLTSDILDGDRFLGITIEEIELKPRMQLVSVPYSFHADKVDNKDAADFVHVTGDTMTGPLVHSGTEQDISTNTNEHLTLMPNGNGKVGIGTTNPGAALDIKNADDDSSALNVTNSQNSTIFSVKGDGAVQVTKWSDEDFSETGYARVGSIMIQWGKYTSTTDDDQYVPFQKSFPNACFSVMTDRSVTHTYTRAGFKVNRFNTVDGSPIHHFIAIGH
jgi:hypothetical protein